jgi:phosphoenolpyruvate carboxykinase (GTP)
MLERLEGKVQGQEHAVGTSPRYQDMQWDGLAFTAEQFDSVSSMNKADWAQELKLHDEHFANLAYHLPAELVQTKAAIEKRLAETA